MPKDKLQLLCLYQVFISFNQLAEKPKQQVHSILGSETTTKSITIYLLYNIYDVQKLSHYFVGYKIALQSRLDKYSNAYLGNEKSEVRD